MTTWITICDTCKREDWDAASGDLTDGEVLAELIENRADGDVKTRRVSCLMGCTRSCNVAIQGAGKLNYTLGEFTPTPRATCVRQFSPVHAETSP